MTRDRSFLERKRLLQSPRATAHWPAPSLANSGGRIAWGPSSSTGAPCTPSDGLAGRRSARQ
ncbi:hypothetical protein C8Q73DRAFT_698453 [Cubamyces lactineus]|nr:hypothetical protein C8Q73DRAFT_698453 [Cubamyces lactineus]